MPSERRPAPPLRPGDHALWDEIRLTIKPLGAKASRIPGKKASGAIRRAEKIAVDTTGQREKPGVRRAESAIALPVPPLQAPDRRTAQRLGRGQIEPDARLDLHGDGLEAARMKLAHFLARQRQDGARLVLVITGKGASPYARHTLHGFGHFHAPEREGRLRREVPRWLAEEQFRQHVVGFQPAHPRHGGGGAFYIRLRKRGDWQP